ncbi:MAG: hypothetical protein AAFR38_06320 [Planctomycetota bacterium]
MRDVVLEHALDRLAEVDRAACPPGLPERIAAQTSISPLRLAHVEQAEPREKSRRPLLLAVLAPVAAAAVLGAALLIVIPSGPPAETTADEAVQQLAFLLEDDADSLIAFGDTDELGMLAMDLGSGHEDGLLIDDSWGLPDFEGGMP